MPKFRFRKTITKDIEAETLKEAKNNLSLECARSYLRGSGTLGDPDEYEYMGPAEIHELSPEMLEFAKKMGDGFLVMSVQYRGENFSCLCKREDLGPDYVSIEPFALLLKEEQKDYIMDPMGNRPESGLREKLNLE